MQRRKFVLGLGSLAAGGAAAMGTGAVSKMNSGERSVTVQVREDSSSFIALKSRGTGPNKHGQFAEVNDEGKLEINVDGSNLNHGKGVNPDSEYYLDNVFRIKNGANMDPRPTHHIWISQNTAERVAFYWGGDPSNSAENSSNQTKLEAGRQQDVGMYIDATGLDPSNEISGDVVISAEDTAND